MRSVSMRILACAGFAALPFAAAAQSPISSDAYIQCSFHPQAAPCERIYRQADKDDNPGAAAVKAAYEGYGRYVKAPSPGMNEADRQYLKDNQISLPEDLAPEDLYGLHNVINDPGLKDAADRRRAVNNYINRAVESELYCGFNGCADGVSLVS